MYVIQITIHPNDYSENFKLSKVISGLEKKLEEDNTVGKYCINITMECEEILIKPDDKRKNNVIKFTKQTKKED